MRTTKSKGRVIVTLARHEKHVAASTIISRLKQNKTLGNLAINYGATVRLEAGTGNYKEMYNIRPDQFVTPAQIMARNAVYDAGINRVECGKICSGGSVI